MIILVQTKKKKKTKKKGRQDPDSNPRHAKAHVPEGRYQIPPGTYAPEFRLHWDFWVVVAGTYYPFAIPAVKFEMMIYEIYSVVDDKVVVGQV